MMTRKHFAAIAAIVAQITVPNNRRETAHRFADWLKGDNPRFDRARFLAACGVKE